ncbi:hypothetical protein ACHQM5_012114 [Ranunculus cassubicifolius]
MMMEEQLDFILVPLGLTLMMGYHLWFLYYITHHPKKTAISINSINRQIWVQAMMEDTSKNGVCAVQTLRNNIMASSLVVTTSIMFTSIIVTLMTHTSSTVHMVFLYGNKTELGLTVKLFSIVACIFLAILLNILSVRYYSEASSLIQVKGEKGGSDILMVERMVNMGNHFWTVGLRLLYGSFTLFMWLFGPIVMFLCSVLLTAMLYFLDVCCVL